MSEESDKSYTHGNDGETVETKGIPSLDALGHLIEEPVDPLRPRPTALVLIFDYYKVSVAGRSVQSAHRNASDEGAVFRWVLVRVSRCWKRKRDGVSRAFHEIRACTRYNNVAERRTRRQLGESILFSRG